MIPVSYSPHLQSNSRKSHNQNTAIRIGFGSARLIGFVLLALLALLYIAQTSQGAAKRGEVNTLRSQADSLSYEQEQLKLEALRLQSIDTISQSVESLHLEPVPSVEHTQ